MECRTSILGGEDKYLLYEIENQVCRNVRWHNSVKNPSRVVHTRTKIPKLDYPVQHIAKASHSNIKELLTLTRLEMAIYYAKLLIPTKPHYCAKLRRNGCQMCQRIHTIKMNRHLFAISHANCNHENTY